MVFDGLGRYVLERISWSRSNERGGLAFHLLPFLEHHNENRRQRHFVIPAAFGFDLHPLSRNGPGRQIEVELVPTSSYTFARAKRGEYKQ